jgi:hypothetical protein
MRTPFRLLALSLLLGTAPSALAFDAETAATFGSFQCTCAYKGGGVCYYNLSSSTGGYHGQFEDKRVCIRGCCSQFGDLCAEDCSEYESRRKGCE